MVLGFGEMMCKVIDNVYLKLVGGVFDFLVFEFEVFDYWFCDDIFWVSIVCCDGVFEYVFYDGLLFVNGLLYYGYLFIGYVKDIVL